MPTDCGTVLKKRAAGLNLIRSKLLADRICFDKS